MPLPRPGRAKARLGRVMPALPSLRVLAAAHAAGPSSAGTLVGDHPEIVRAREVATAAARSGSHVLVLGEEGTGKELFARILHAQASCPGLFLAWGGGSVRDLHAAISSAADGVLYVEELLDLRPETQAHLQRALEEGAPVQIVAASVRDPRLAASRGELRPELLHRLERCSLRLAPLRERRQDIPLLVHHFLSSFCSRRCGCLQGVGEDAMRVLGAHEWPGNVRELRAAVEHAVTSGRSPWITARDLPPPLGVEVTTDEEDYELPTLAESEGRLIRLTLQRFRGNKVRAARSLGISRHKLYERLRKLGIAG